MRRAALLARRARAAGCGSYAAQRRRRPSAPGRRESCGSRSPTCRGRSTPRSRESRDEIELARCSTRRRSGVGPARAHDAGSLLARGAATRRAASGRCAAATRPRSPAELRRVAALAGGALAPGSSPTRRGSRRSGDELRIVLRRPWRRFPYALTAVAAAPRGVAGPVPRRLRVAGPPRRRRGRGCGSSSGGWSRTPPRPRSGRGELDEAPVALGDIRAARLDPGARRNGALVVAARASTSLPSSSATARSPTSRTRAAATGRPPTGRRYAAPRPGGRRAGRATG